MMLPGGQSGRTSSVAPSASPSVVTSWKWATAAEGTGRREFDHPAGSPRRKAGCPVCAIPPSQRDVHIEGANALPVHLGVGARSSGPAGFTDEFMGNERLLNRNRKEWRMLAMAGTGYGLIGLLVIVLLVVLIFYFARRA